MSRSSARIVASTVVVALVATAASTISNSRADKGAAARASGAGPVATAAAGKRGPRGFRGPRGYRGRAGAPGAPGAPGTPGSPGLLRLVTVEGPHESVPSGGLSSPNLDANCPAGMQVVGTGYFASLAHAAFVKAYGTFVGGVIHNDTSITLEVHLQAICAQLPPGATVASAGSRAAARRQFLADRAAALTAR